MSQKPQSLSVTNLCAAIRTNLEYKSQAFGALSRPLCQFNTTLSGVALALTIAHSSQVSAADITVNTTNPVINLDNQCSLIEAINNANSDAATHTDCPAGSGADTLILSAGTYTLNSSNNESVNGANGLPQITSVISIQGNGATIQRDSGANDVFRLLQVNKGAQLNLKQTTVSGGSASSGGAIHNDGTLTISNSTISGNSASRGGGIFNKTGDVTLTHSTVSGNSATLGGGIYNFSGNISLSYSTVSGNSGSFSGHPNSFGGGIRTNTGTITLSNSTISDNSARGGGGISNYSGVITLAHCSLSGNFADSSGGGIQNVLGRTTLIHSTISGGRAISGGGIVSGTGSGGTLVLNNTTVSGNSAEAYGGGIRSYSAGSITFTNSTISGNSASRGGGFFNQGGSNTLIHSTITGNSAKQGGGIYNTSGNITNTVLTKSVISGNTATNSGAEIFQASATIFDPESYQSSGLITAGFYNVFGHSGLTNTQAFFGGFAPSGSDINATSDGDTPTVLSSILNPTLADNGGFTQTHALVEESPAIDAVAALNCTVSQDQRVASRPVDGGSGVENCDTGAYEFGAIIPPPNPLDIDGNGITDALTDGLLIIRYLLGLTGNTLIDGVVAKDAIRTTAAEIEVWLLTQKASNTLEIDGNANARALTDGLLLIRYLFGLRGNALINDVVDNDATRTTAAEIEARVQSLLNL